MECLHLFQLNKTYRYQTGKNFIPGNIKRCAIEILPGSLLIVSSSVFGNPLPMDPTFASICALQTIYLNNLGKSLYFYNKYAPFPFTAML